MRPSRETLSSHNTAFRNAHQLLTGDSILKSGISDWKSIDTAPGNSTYILVRSTNTGRLALGHFANTKWITSDDEDGTDFFPDQWISLENIKWKSTSAPPIDSRLILINYDQDDSTTLQVSLGKYNHGKFRIIDSITQKEKNAPSITPHSWANIPYTAEPNTTAIEQAPIIAGIVRFSVLSTLANPFKAWRDQNFESYSDHILSDERMERRFDLFENITLPSLQAQNTQNFIIYAITAKLLNDRWKQRLEALTDKYKFLRIHYEDAENFVMRMSSKVILSEVDTSRPFATFRLDDDDALRADFTTRLARYIKPQFQKMAVSLSKGFIVHIDDNHKVGIQPFLHPNASAGIAVIGGKRFTKTIFDISDKHIRMHVRLPVVNDGREPAFILTTHGSNDTGAKRSADNITLSRLEAQEELISAGFHINLEDLNKH